MAKTQVIKKDDITHAWYIIDANDYTLGKLAVKIASLLIGKKKLQYATNLFSGDEVIVINAKNLHLNERKVTSKLYHKHSGFPGGLKEVTFERLMQKSPRSVVTNAVKGMVPKTKMGREMLRHLHVFNDANHPHGAQQPIIVS